MENHIEYGKIETPDGQEQKFSIKHISEQSDRQIITIDHIDEKIEALEARIKDLKTHRDALLKL